MSVRVHVVGAYGAEESEFRAALDTIGDEGNGSQRFRMGSSGKWMWANASVWHVGSSAIDAALSTLSAPALRVTSSDGVMWMIAITGAGRDRFHGAHHFTYVGEAPAELDQSEADEDDEFPADELDEVAGINKFIPELQFLWDADEEARLMKEYAEEEAATVEGLDDYTDYGVSLPDAVVQEMKRNPARAAYTAFMSHGQQIVDALDEFGFEFDRNAVFTLLTVGPMTERELDSDVGNMQRFLEALGIEGVFLDEPEPLAGDADEAEIQGAETRDWSDYPPDALFEKVQPLRAECALSQIVGGNVNVTHLACLHRMSHLFAEDPVTSLVVELPAAITPQVESWCDLSGLEVQHVGTQWQFCFETCHWWSDVEDPQELDTNGLTEALGSFPPGTRIELTCVVDGLREKCHRYVGTIGSDRFVVERAYPAVSAEILGEALELVAQTLGSKSIKVLSAAEEEAARHAYQRSEGEALKMRNSKIMPEPGSRECVVQALMLERFKERGPWDTAGACELIDADWQMYEEVANPSKEDAADELGSDGQADEAGEFDPSFTAMLQAMSNATVEFNEAKKVPHSSDVLYEGQTGKFLRASMADLTHIPRDRLQEHDATLARLGFRPIVDSVGDVDQRQELTRCYGGHSQAISLLGHRNENNQFGWVEDNDGATLVDFSRGSMEFHTDFEDGSSLVTSSVDTVTSQPHAGIYVRSYEGVPVTRLWEKHLDGIQRFNEHRQTQPVDHMRFSDPAKMMARADRLFARFLGLN